MKIIPGYRVMNQGLLYVATFREKAVYWSSYPRPSRALAFWSRMALAASGSIWGSLM